MSKSRYLLEQHTVSELFTVVYVLVDDYLKTGVQQGRFVLPESKQQKGSYSELMTIALVGDLLNQANVGLWFNLVKREYCGLFPLLPDDTRYYLPQDRRPQLCPRLRFLTPAPPSSRGRTVYVMTTEIEQIAYEDSKTRRQPA